MEEKFEKEKFEVIETEYRPPDKEEARWFFDYSKLIWEIRAKLLGGYLTQDKEGKYVILKPKNAKPFMNEEGIEATIAIINGFVTDKIHGLTIFNDLSRIMQLCKDLHITLAKFYYVNMERYGLDPSKASVIIRMIVGLFEANLRKSLGGVSMKLIGSTERVVETKSESKGKLGGLLPW